MEFSTPLDGIANPKIDVVYSFPFRRLLHLPYVHGIACLNDLFREFPLSVSSDFLIPAFLVQCRGPTGVLYSCQNELITGMRAALDVWSAAYRKLNIDENPMVMGFVNVSHTWELWCMKTNGQV